MGIGKRGARRRAERRVAVRDERRAARDEASRALLDQMLVDADAGISVPDVRGCDLGDADTDLVAKAFVALARFAPMASWVAGTLTETGHDPLLPPAALEYVPQYAVADWFVDGNVVGFVAACGRVPERPSKAQIDAWGDELEVAVGHLNSSDG